MSRKVDLIERETLYQGFFRLDRLTLRHELFSGGMSGPITREMFERGSAAYCLPYDPGSGRVVLLEQFRPGPLAAGDENPWMIEVVAGVIEEGEAPEAVARREGEEEAGLTITDLVPAPDCFPSPGGCSERFSLFVGRVDASTAGGIHGLDDENEDIRVFTCTLEEAVAMVDDGRINNAGAMVLLYWLARHHDAVDRRWKTG